MKTYLAINLDDFHKNAQDGQTISQIRFVTAVNMKKAKALLTLQYPANNWSLVPESYFNRNVVFKQRPVESSSQ